MVRWYAPAQERTLEQHGSGTAGSMAGSGKAQGEQQHVLAHKGSVRMDSEHPRRHMVGTKV